MEVDKVLPKAEPQVTREKTSFSASVSQTTRHLKKLASNIIPSKKKSANARNTMQILGKNTWEFPYSANISADTYRKET